MGSRFGNKKNIGEKRKGDDKGRVNRVIWDEVKRDNKKKLRSRSEAIPFVGVIVVLVSQLCLILIETSILPLLPWYPLFQLTFHLARVYNFLYMITSFFLNISFHSFLDWYSLWPLCPQCLSYLS